MNHTLCVALSIASLRLSVSSIYSKAGQLHWMHWSLSSTTTLGLLN